MTYLAWDSYDTVDFRDIIGKTIERVEKTSDKIEFFTDCGEHYQMYHRQSCCEDVNIDAIDGDLEKLVGGRVWDASESSNDRETEWGGQLEWTYYRIRTDQEFCHITWRGTSNGYYSTSVSFIKMRKPEDGNA